MTGPYDSESAAAADAPKDRSPHEQFLAVCAAAGVDLGVFDAQIVYWLATTWESATTQVFADLVRRAHEAGQAAGWSGAADYIEHADRTVPEHQDERLLQVLVEGCRSQAARHG